MTDRDRDRPMGHAEDNDGIEEYDNPLPDWWVGLFWLTTIWAVGYGVHYHFIAERSQVKALAAEIEVARERWPEGQQVPFVMSPEAIARGRTVYMQNCTGCHGAALEGGIGPNLKDGNWIHGGAPHEVVGVIAKGVPAKGMIAWGSILGPEKINDVAAFVLSAGSAESAGQPPRAEHD
jgi:cytochrome c oxidase cbb3-type subunit III